MAIFTKIDSFLKSIIKNIVHHTGLSLAISELQFQAQRTKHLLKNLHFKKHHPYLAIPKDRDLFETFQVNYPLYFSDGKLAAKEMLEWSGAYLKNEGFHVLDWGCGVGRIIQHIPSMLPKAICYGADINQQRIKWCRKNINDVLFDCIEDEQLPYPSELFDLVFGISVFTHIQGDDQTLWLKELQRITKPGAVIIVSTHGSFFENKMSSEALQHYHSKGWQSNQYHEKGHRLLSTFNKAVNFKEIAAQYFTIEAFYEGKSHPDKLGGQDLWILRKQ
ncbi:MAG: class I SAM-dependent methyltransferase [Sphingobacteriia bacterium]|nr:MAG: class I SAM-dependent methyltransferase [Sphingobacteriia bacterium]